MLASPILEFLKPFSHICSLWLQLCLWKTGIRPSVFV